MSTSISQTNISITPHQPIFLDSILGPWRFLRDVISNAAGDFVASNRLPAEEQWQSEK